MTVGWLVIASGLPALTLAAAVLIRTLLVVVTVENQSMSPTLEHGDRVLAVRRWPSWWLRKGQIVLVWPWSLPASGPEPFRVVPFIKRVVGLPGETLVTSLVELSEDYRARELPAHDSEGRRVWRIPPGHIFVRGDYPIGGFDSLSWGPISSRCVLGLVIRRLPSQAIPVDARTHPAPTDGPPVGRRARAFTAKTLDGERVTLADYLGRTVAFLFIAPNDLCRAALPSYEALRPIAARAGVDLVLVSGVDVARTRAFISEIQVSLPVLVAPKWDNSFIDDYNITGTPSYCLIDIQGTVQAAGSPGLDGGQWKTLTEAWAAGETTTTALAQR